MIPKMVVPMMVAALVVADSGAVRGDQPRTQADLVAVVPADPAPSQKTLPPAQKLTLRDKLIHWPSLIHSRPPCASCNLTDPDFCCSTCRSNWIFFFGSCRAFYGEPRSRQSFVYVPAP